MIDKWHKKDWTALTDEQQGWIKFSLSGNLANTIRTNNKSLSSADADKLAELVKNEPSGWGKNDVKLLQDAFDGCNMDISYGEPNHDAYLQTLKKEYGTTIAFDIHLAQSLQDGINRDIERNKEYSAKAVKEIRNKSIRTSTNKMKMCTFIKWVTLARSCVLILSLQ